MHKQATAIMEDNCARCCFLCQAKENLKQCPHCTAEGGDDGIWYCDDDHLRVHRPPGLDTCLPFRSAIDVVNFGRHLVATHDISAGEIVVLDSAVVVGPDFLPVCLGCFRPIGDSADMHRCRKCRFPVCGPSCEENPVHAGMECELFESCGISPPSVTTSQVPHSIYKCIGILRVVLAQRKSERTRKDVESLQSHASLRRQDPDVVEAIARMTGFFREKCRLDDVSFDDVLHAFGVLKTNSMAYKDLSAIGLYPVLSLCSHSCEANLDPMAQIGSKFGFRAARKIGKGQQLTIQYVNSFRHRLPLRTELRDQWFFECRCPRCQDGTEFGTFLSSPLCRRKRRRQQDLLTGECGGCGGWYLPLDPLSFVCDWKCSECGEIISANEILLLDDEARTIEEDASRDGSVPAIVLALENLLKDYHPNYHSVVKLKISYITNATASESESDDTMIGYCQDVVRVLEALSRGSSTKRQQQIEAFAMKARLARLNGQRKLGRVSKEQYFAELSCIMKAHKSMSLLESQ